MNVVMFCQHLPSSVCPIAVGCVRIDSTRQACAVLRSRNSAVLRACGLRDEANHSSTSSTCSCSAEPIRTFQGSRRLLLCTGFLFGASAATPCVFAEPAGEPAPIPSPGKPSAGQAASSSEPGAAPEGPAQDSTGEEGLDGSPEAANPDEALSAAAKRRKTVEEYEQEAQRILEEEEAAKAEEKRRKRNRLQDLQEVREALRRKQVIVLQREEELLEKEQTLAVLREELELERSLRALLTKEKEKAEEQARLALGLCGQGFLLP
mmetsp:Transcript_9206/g.22189  ORF Transcript_9206/g.22189 Transcript_9206/m.22189 type:complete len:264 (+) Transcript_9206:237-1028(+)